MQAVSTLGQMRGIISYGAHVPYRRLDRGEITKFFGSGGGKGTRAVASYDEDTTSMGTEAARAALAAIGPDVQPAAVFFATTPPRSTPPYAWIKTYRPST
jgi:hydroxymethylglutaryl-CoA synthase